MQDTRWRFEVRVIDRRVLAHFIKHRRYSYAQLAERVGCSKATIGHLVSGHVKVTRREWAEAIERCLDAPEGSLFERVAYRVSENAA